MEIRFKIDFGLILKSDEPNFIDLKREWGVFELSKPVMALTDSFLRSTFPDQVEIASDVAVALIEREPTWTLPDVLNFYKTILHRQDHEGFKVFGNKITVLRLMEMVGVYEDLRAQEREKIIAEKKGSYYNEMEGRTRSSSDQSVKALMGKELERIYVESEKRGPSKDEKVIPDEKFFNQFTK